MSVRQTPIVKVHDKLADNILLSIDLDYFNDFGESRMDEVFSHVMRLSVPILIVNSHDMLVPFFKNYSNYSTLINVDFHSDLLNIVDSNEYRMDCGCWVNFMPHEDRQYIWVHTTFDGCCMDDPDFWTPEQASTRNWQNIRYTRQLSVIKWRRVIAVGIALSEPEYTERSTLYYFLQKWYRPLISNGASVRAECKPRIEHLLHVADVEYAYRCKGLTNEVHSRCAPSAD